MHLPAVDRKRKWSLPEPARGQFAARCQESTSTEVKRLSCVSPQDSDQAPQETRMKIRAAVLDKSQQPPPYAETRPISVETVDLDAPGPG